MVAYKILVSALVPIGLLWVSNWIVLNGLDLAELGTNDFGVEE